MRLVRRLLRRYTFWDVSVACKAPGGSGRPVSLPESTALSPSVAYSAGPGELELRPGMTFAKEGKIG